MITIFAEKPDVGIKIAVALAGLTHNGVKITMNNVEKYKDKIERSVANDGFIEINYKGEDYTITWAKGHLVELKQAYDYDEKYKKWSELPIPFIPDEYEIKVKNQYDYKTKKLLDNPDPWASKQLKVIKELFDKSDYIINATDFDREGELIFAYVYQIVGSDKPYKRAVIDSLTQDGLVNTFDNLKDQEFTEGTELAGRGRAIADWVVGINLTVLMSLKYGSKDLPLISVGRVQTPTLNMIVEREKEIQNFKSEPFWRVIAEFDKDGEKFEAEHEEKRFDKKEDADSILSKINGKDGVVIEHTEKKSSRKVPLLYNLTSLTMDANTKHSIGASETLNIAQDLYSSGFITYPRSGSQHLTDDMKGVVDDVLDMLAKKDEYRDYIEAVDKGDRNYTKRHFDTKKVDSHYAIIPTNQDPGKLSGDKAKIYDLIAKSLIRIIYKDAEIMNTNVVIDVDGEKFKASGSVITDKQWMGVDATPNFTVLPGLSKGDELQGDYRLHEGKTTPPPRYNDSSLLSAMVTAGKQIEDDELRAYLEEFNDSGIGRDSTRANIMANVVSMYCTRKGKQIIPTDRAMKMIDILPIDDIKSPALTAEWEKELDRVEKGEIDLDGFIDSIEEKTEEWCSEINKLPTPARESFKRDIETLKEKCPKCGKDVLIFKWGYVCEDNRKNDKKCDFFIPAKISSKNITKTIVNKLIKDGETEYFKKLKSKNDKYYGAKFRLDDDKKLEIDFNSDINCKICNKPMSSNSMFYYCRDQECNFSVPFSIASVDLKDSDVRDLIEKGETREIKNFMSKKGRPFSARLVLNSNNKVEFNIY